MGKIKGVRMLWGKEKAEGDAWVYVYFEEGHFRRMSMKTFVADFSVVASLDTITITEREGEAVEGFSPPLFTDEQVCKLKQMVTKVSPEEDREFGRLMRETMQNLITHAGLFPAGEKKVMEAAAEQVEKVLGKTGPKGKTTTTVPIYEGSPDEGKKIGTMEITLVEGLETLADCHRFIAKLQKMVSEDGITIRNLNDENKRLAKVEVQAPEKKEEESSDVQSNPKCMACGELRRWRLAHGWLVIHRLSNLSPDGSRGSTWWSIDIGKRRPAYNPLHLFGYRVNIESWKLDDGMTRRVNIDARMVDRETFDAIGAQIRKHRRADGTVFSCDFDDDGARKRHAADS